MNRARIIEPEGVDLERLTAYLHYGSSEVAAAKTGCSVYTIRRVWRRYRRYLLSMLQATAGEK